MKYLKRFEYITDIEVGDYVICNIDTQKTDIDNFLKCNIGVVTSIRKFDEYAYPYLVKFDELSDDVRYYSFDTDHPNTIEFNRNEIINFSKNREELQIFLDSNKYNL